MLGGAWHWEPQSSTPVVDCCLEDADGKKVWLSRRPRSDIRHANVAMEITLKRCDKTHQMFTVGTYPLAAESIPGVVFAKVVGTYMVAGAKPNTNIVGLSFDGATTADFACAALNGNTCTLKKAKELQLPGFKDLVPTSKVLPLCHYRGMKFNGRYFGYWCHALRWFWRG